MTKIRLSIFLTGKIIFGVIIVSNFVNIMITEILQGHIFYVNKISIYSKASFKFIYF